MTASDSSPFGKEAARLDALDRCRILDTPRESVYDDLAQLAAQLCDTPMAAIAFLERDRQWFKAAHGFGDHRETPHELAFCTQAIQENSDLMVVPDTLADPRFADHPMVRGEPGLRFYAGISLRSPEGRHILGTLCVLDSRPRQLEAAGKQALRQLARQLDAHLQARRNVAELQRTEAERERVVAELRETLAHIKTLKGFLPICSSCKNIRDDAGYWQHIESYLRDHSELEFTHGICPRCAEKLYPEFSAMQRRGK